jgi:hypothetical protein
VVTRWHAYQDRLDTGRQRLGVVRADSAAEALAAARLRVKGPMAGGSVVVSRRALPDPGPRSPAWGRRNLRLKLNEEKAVAIREAAEADTPVAKLARQYGVSCAAIRDVIKRRSWTHV